jgi:hypothetical protein
MHQTACLSGIKVAKPYRIRAGHRLVDGSGRRFVLRERLSYLLNAHRQFTDLLGVHGPKLIDIMQIEARISQSTLPQLVKLMTLVKMFDRLLKSNSDQQPDNNRRDVDEEVFPRVGWFVWCMNVEHKRSSVYSYCCIVTF